MKTFLKWLLVATLFSCSCCGIGLNVCGSVLTNADWQAPMGGEVVDLGEAAHPLGTLEPVKRYDWRPAFGADLHRVRYILETDVADQLEYEFERYVRRNARSCLELECPYEYLWESNAEAVDELAERFAERIREAGLRQDEAAALVISFVQEIAYEIPTEQPFEVLPPALVVAQGRGDCDSKALLAIMILRKLEVPAELLISLPLKHAAVGVALPGTGTAFRHGGQRYRYAEVTATGWPIGQMPPEWDKPHLWSVMRVGH